MDEQELLDDSDLIVDEEETFPIVIYYRVIKDEMGNKVAVETISEDVLKELSDEEKAERWEQYKWRKVEANFIQPSSQAFGGVLEDSTIINHVNFRPLLRTWTMREAVLLRFMKTWSLMAKQGGQGVPVMLPIHPEILGDLHYEVSQALFIEYMNKTKMAAELKSALKDEEAARLTARAQLNIPASEFMPPMEATRPQTMPEEMLPPTSSFPVIYGAQ